MMKKKMYIIGMPFVFFLQSHCATPQAQLFKLYEEHVNNTSDIRDHLPALREVARECSSVMEIGIRDMVSTWAVLQGLSENGLRSKHYIGIDLDLPPVDKFDKASRLSKECNIVFDFWQINDMAIAIEDVPAIDFLFIDSLHTYCHLTYELEKFCPKVCKYIAMHDTSEPWGEIDDFQQYSGDYSEYPAHFDRTRKGLWAAVEDFLIRHPEWTLHKRYYNCHGLTILKRIES